MDTKYLNEFTDEKVCEYKGRQYFVRDNGAIYRQCKSDGIKRDWDEEWTFGRFDQNTGYMFIGQERVHRIVCTAYHGVPEGDRNIVDHIDTNRCNNRPDNLRWVTKLENILLNPITRAKVELICGSIEAFLENPELLFNHESEDPNFSWMRVVSPEEAKRSLERWKEWTNKPKEQRLSIGERKGPGEWIYDPIRVSTSANDRDFEDEDESTYYDSLTPNAKQVAWKTPTEFLMCPTGMPENPLEAYKQNMEIDKIFCRNCYGESFLKDVGYTPEGDALVVLTYQPEGVKTWYLSGIYIENGKFIHESIRSYFEETGGRKYFTIHTGKAWTGGDVFDDYC